MLVQRAEWVSKVLEYEEFLSECIRCKLSRSHVEFCRKLLAGARANVDRIDGALAERVAESSVFEHCVQS